MVRSADAGASTISIVTLRNRVIAVPAAALLLAVVAGCTIGGPLPGQGLPEGGTGKPSSAAAEAGASTPTAEAVDQSRLPAATAVDPALFMIDDGSSEPVPEFVSPSGNISCAVYGAAREYAEVACYIGEHTWEYPPCDAPACSALTILDRSGVVGIRRRGGAELAIELGYAVRTLQYGESLSFGDVTCVATEDGVFCEDGTTFHGFAASRSTYSEY